MTQNQFRGIVDNLANVCIFNTTNSFSLSLDETQYGGFCIASILVFSMHPRGFFCASDIEVLLSLASIWNVNLYFETVNGVTVAKFL